MSLRIQESDWKVFRQLHPIALERFCFRIIGEINRASSNCDGNYHERYLEIFRLIMDRNQEMASAFDDIRRSTALILLARIKKMHLLTDEELSEFSSEVRQAMI